MQLNGVSPEEMLIASRAGGGSCVQVSHLSAAAIHLSGMVEFSRNRRAIATFTAAPVGPSAISLTEEEEQSLQT